MKEYIVLAIINNSLVFNYRQVKNDEKVFVNKNKFYKNSLFYTFKYYKRHLTEIIGKLIKENENIDTLRILRLINFKYVLPLIRFLEITDLYLDFSSTISLQDYDLFLNTDIQNMYCYYMPIGVRKKFNLKNINVVTSLPKNISFRFATQQDAFENDTLYYKKVIKIKEDYPELIDDLREFLNINYNLKAIHVYVYSKELIKSIVNLVKNDESRNVIVFLHQEYDKGNFIVNNFEWLKGLSKQCKKDYTCEFRIIYANSFLKNNLFKQLTFNNLKLISVLSVYVCIVCLVIIKSYDYIEKLSVDKLNMDLFNQSYASNINRTEQDIIEGNFELTEDDINVDIDAEEPKEDIVSKYKFDNSLGVLKSINNETVGYLMVKDTNIYYPVLQHSDNNYYLTHDIYKKKNAIGWIYLDYRNNYKELNDNTIIYGHSMLNGTMFGTLKKVLNSSWRNNEENMIISLDTENGNYKFKIFSIYKVDYTTDYLKINFDSKVEKTDFIKLIKNRSMFNLGVDVDEDDKILTLSTCAKGNNKRLVVHAVLLKEEE